MIVQVRLFAGARDLVGADHVAVHLPAQATVGDLRRHLGNIQPALAALLARSAVAVDQEFAEDSLLLTEDIEIALLPPVSGG
jgi:molybdopterin converting factor subunit 1